MRRVLCLVVLVCVVQCLAMSKDELEDFSNFLLKTSSLDIHVKKGADPDVSFDEDDVTSDHAWEESGKFEGDLILNDRQRRLIVENVEGLSRNGLSDSTKRWPSNEVIYFIQKEHFSSGQVQAIQDGIDDLGRASCVKFRPYKKGDRDAVVIQGSRRGCFSQVGYQGGYQVLNLSGRHPVGRGCFRHGTVVHELLHTLGFYHMQSSPDRDDYIDVVWANIVQPARHNFRKYNSFSVSDFGVGYDYDSVLHYSRRAFSANGQDTLVPKKSGAEIGQRVGLSDKDTQKLNKMYCDADNDAVQADENTAQKPKIKKKKPKNQPFQGHGIGYHQGKTVVIKLPAAQTFKLPNMPSTPVFDFSKTPEVVSSPEAGGYRFGKEVTDPFKSIFSLNTETVMEYQNSYEVDPIQNKKNTEKQQPAANDDKAEFSNTDNGNSSPQHTNDSNEVKPEYAPSDEHDKDSKDAFDRLTKIVKQHVYPVNQGYTHKINKDYTIFYTPRQLRKTDTGQESLDEKFNKQISYHLPTTILEKQIDAKQNKLEPFANSNDKLKNIHFADRMDTSYRTLLPTKQTYDSYMRTETPQYATLEYLKNRHDFSDIYVAKSLQSDKNSDESTEEGDKYKQDFININPHDKGFYTDDVIKGRLTDATREENTSKEEKLSKYGPAERPINKQLDSTNKQLTNMDSSYRTSLPTKQPYSALEQTETPTYATLEYLKDRHDFSSLYKPKTSDNKKRKQFYTVVGDEPPTEDDWYKKDSYKHNPANYDRDSYSDYIQDDSSERDKGDNKRRILDASHYDDNSTESPKKPQGKDKTMKYGPDIYRKNEKEKSERINDDSVFYSIDDERETPNEKQTKYNGNDYDHGYYTDYDKDDNANLTDVLNDKDKNGRDLLKSNKSAHAAAKYDHDYDTDYTKKRNPANERDYKNTADTELPNKSEPYTLYGVSVPLTRDWYKPSFFIPGISREDENSRSRED